MNDITNGTGLVPVENQKPPAMIFSNRTYDLLKYLAQIFLPAFGVLYFGLAKIWGLPFGDQISGTVLVVDTFLGAILLLSAKSYNKSDAKFDGVLNVTENEDGLKQASLELKNYENPADVVQQKEVLFKVTAS